MSACLSLSRLTGISVVTIFSLWYNHLQVNPWYSCTPLPWPVQYRRPTGRPGLTLWLTAAYITRTSHWCHRCGHLELFYLGFCETRSVQTTLNFSSTRNFATDSPSLCELSLSYALYDWQRFEWWCLLMTLTLISSNSFLEGSLGTNRFHISQEPTYKEDHSLPCHHHIVCHEVLVHLRLPIFLIEYLQMHWCFHVLPCCWYQC